MDLKEESQLTHMNESSQLQKILYEMANGYLDAKDMSFLLCLRCLNITRPKLRRRVREVVRAVFDT